VALDGNGRPVKEERKAKASLSFPGAKASFSGSASGQYEIFGLTEKFPPVVTFALGHMARCNASLEFSHQSHSGFDNDIVLLQYGIYALVCFADEYIY